MKVIEFLGMARAGKTTQIDRLKTYLESKGHRSDTSPRQHLSRRNKAFVLDFMYDFSSAFHCCTDRYLGATSFDDAQSNDKTF